LRRTIESVIADSPRGATVTIEESAKALASANATELLHRRHSIDPLVVQALVIPFTMVVLDELGDRPSETEFSSNR